MFFDWNDGKSWRPLVAAFSNMRITPDVISSVLTSKHEGLAVYHGCRTADVNLYYDAGLQRSCSTSLDKLAHSIFVARELTEITPQKLTEVTEKLGPRDDGRIYACLDSEWLLQYAGHYLIYGSERLCAIASSLTAEGLIDYRQILKRIGRPTILKVRVEWKYVSCQQLKEFCVLLAKSLRDIRGGKTLPIEDFTFSFREDLPGSAILSHEHPSDIADPLLNMTMYKFSEKSA